MKNPSVVSFLITLLAAAVFTHGKEPVKDTAGDSLNARELYFIQPVKTKSKNGGGLVPAAITVLPFCPLGITQTLLPYQPGLPVGFVLPLGVRSTVMTSSAVNIEFRANIWPFCKEFSKFWEVDDSSSAPMEPSILIGGKLGEQNSSFKIEKAGEGARANVYKLTTFYGTVGAIPGVWLSAPQLIVTNDTAKTLLVKFKKVDDTTRTAATSSRVENLGLRMFPFYY